ncbi:nischarin-like isoform X2 [Mya arenaria]|uniref:nischarin-like isoform X2 n=1 Tax=Mya arenaria TaxID=6604 RepID=UPI0022E3BF94|nr:nischarin-like isoform X2 [Mya arenaria]
MAHFGKDIDNITTTSSIKINETQTVETYTLYTIEVTVGPYSWTVKHRYSDFHDLHEKLCSLTKLERNLLPPKKLFGNQSEQFIKKRQHDLQVYLQTVLHYVSHKIPSCLSTFLHFEKYEIHGITQGMAEELYNRGDAILQNRETYCTSPLHLYSLTERLKLPEPTCDGGDVKRDLGHILDFITRLKCLQVTGKMKIGTSNIDMNALNFDLSLFKSLQTLELGCCNIGLIGGLEVVKQTLKSITVGNSISSLKEILLHDLPHWKADDGTVLVTPWDGIRQANFSHNSLSRINECVQLIPKTVRLEMSHNKITSIENLHWLSNMVHLDLSYNDIEELDALHSKLGNLKTLNLAGNRLTSLQGFSKLFSLEHLDLGYNQIGAVEEIKAISRLPCLERLLLLSNPVTLTLDYRTKTLTLFGDRVKEVLLDKTPATEKELDTVAVMQAIQKSRDKAKDIKLRKGPSSASLANSPLATSLGRSSSNPNLLNQSGSRNSLGRMQSKSSFSGYHSNYDEMPGPSDAVGCHDNTGASTSAVDTSLELPGTSTQHDQLSPYSGNKARTSSSTSQDRLSSRPSSTSSYSPIPSGQLTVDISSLPTHHNPAYNSALHERLFGSPEESGSSSATEVIKYILWCQVIQYSNSDTTQPCCVVLTERRIFVLQLKNAESSIQEVPALETFYILPLCNIQQVMVGLCYSFVRVEESFVGASGTFAFIAADSDKGKDFFEELKQCSENDTNCGELDIVNCYQDCRLSRQIFEQEENDGECTGRVANAAYVTESDSQSKAFLVMSENHVYIIKTDVFFIPKPSFEVDTKSESEEDFEIFEKFSVGAEIGEIRMNNEKGRTESKELVPPLSPSLRISYEEHGLSMVFHEILGFHKFDYKFLSTRARDTFLDGLTKLRSEHAHQIMPTSRQDPEGGNESSESSEDQSDKKDHSGSDGPHEESDNEGIEEGKSGNQKNDGCDVVDGISEVGFDINVGPKLRSKTEIILTKPGEDYGDELKEMELPSYAMHYLTPELTAHLESCVKNYTLFQSLSPKMKALTEMSGERIAQFFHLNVIPVGQEYDEELHHIMWTNAISYTNPLQEILTCVMLSTRAVYFLSDRLVSSNRSTNRPSWMTHARHVSDSVIGARSRITDRHHSSGILLSSKNDSTMIKPHCILDFSDIYHVNVGLFDQCVRLTGKRREKVFTLVTRDAEATSLFIKQFSTMLNLYISSPSLEKSSSDIEQDFYKSSDRRTKTTLEGIEYTHPSKVKFCYPGDETIEDLLFLINEHLKSAALKVGRENILQYIVGYKTHLSMEELDLIPLEPISIILTNECLCFVTEDLVSYPLPDFVRGLPSIPRQHVTDVRKIEYLKCIKQRKNNARDITLVFSDEKEDIILVPDHYSLEEGCSRDSPKEIPFRLFIQNERELNKFLTSLKNRSRDLHQMHDELQVIDI